MRSPSDTAREYWCASFTEHGSTRIPRWKGASSRRFEHVDLVPADVASRLSALGSADGSPVPLAVLLAAHAKVVSVLTGETDVVVGFRHGEAAEAVPLPLSTRAPTWRGLVDEAHLALETAVEHAGVDIDRLRSDLGLTELPFETVVLVDDMGAATVVDAAPLVVSASSAGDCIHLVVRGRGEAFDADAVMRVAGYHLAALRLLAEQPDAPHEQAFLLSDDEVRRQIDGFCGVVRTLPDRRAHELFEEQAALRPNAVAATCGGQGWTFAALNARANQIARALRARGLEDEHVVAVVFERNLDWMASVLGVMKAGGVYLPIEPQFPPDRIARTLNRAQCRLALTESSGAANLDQVLSSMPDIGRLTAAEAYDEGHAADDLGVEVRADQLAYIYFTSGSTGQPKGAMCEHAGMLNHLLAKINDLEIAAGQTVAQTAPQCFDISLWQLIAGPIVGGRTAIIEQELILDVARFVETVEAERVAVLQVVPSYIDVVVSYLEQAPHALPDLRFVSVTGEALKRELIARWFKVRPGVRLVNAYGLTETSDDTNHEVMDQAPPSDRVPLGRPIANVRAYVLDEQRLPVPLGTPGVIAFGGVCVGRGYVNDPERTAEAYLDDPYHPGERMYWTGDYGCWQPDGKLAYLGRRDAQVKVAGFRIEIGEIENALLTAPGVRDGAVVVVGSGQATRLIAFYSGAVPGEASQLRDRLAASLPSYMVPGVLHWRERLPLTDNGKIDRSALARLAESLSDDGAQQVDEGAPTPAERRLAVAWAKTLGVDEAQVKRTDNFFDRGGTSLSAVKLVLALGRQLTVKDVTGNPVFRDLASRLEASTHARGRAEEAPELLRSP